MIHQGSCDNTRKLPTWPTGSYIYREVKVRGNQATIQQDESFNWANLNQLLQCGVCWKSHTTKDCPTFKSQSYEKKYELLKQKGLCFSCLERAHRIKNFTKKECRKGGCKKIYNPLLHSPISTNEAESEPIAKMNTSSRPVSAVALGMWEMLVISSGGKPVKDRVLIHHPHKGVICWPSSTQTGNPTTEHHWYHRIHPACNCKKDNNEGSTLTNNRWLLQSDSLDSSNSMWTC